MINPVAATMKHAWYGPLIELASISSHLGCHAQLVVFILQSHPPERVRTMKGKEVLRSILYVGDSSCSQVKVSLWNEIVSCHDISAGDIIFMQNMRVVKFRGQMELTSAQFSEIVPLLKQRDFFSYQGLEDGLKAWQHGPLLKERFKTIVGWAQNTQHSFLLLLNRIARISHHQEKSEDMYGVACKNVEMRGEMDTSAPEVQVRKCSSIVEALSIQDHCIVEFYATIGEIFLTCGSRSGDSTLSHDGCLLFSKNLFGKEAEGLLKELLCLGCETCGRVLCKDKNGVYEGCRCGVMPPPRATDHHQRAKQKQACRIFRPFFLHVGDHSSQTTVLVKHDAAVQMFGNISADSVFESLRGSLSLDQAKQCAENGGNDGGAQRLWVEEVDHGLVLTILLRSLLSNKNSPFRLRAVCDPSLGASLEYLRLASISLPILT